MENHVSRTSALNCVPIPCLGELRKHLLTALIGNILFSEAEQLRAKYFIHECENVDRLTRWQVNVLAEITRRKAEAARLRRYHAVCSSMRKLPPVDFRCHRLRAPRLVPTWVPGAPLPDRTHRHADAFDRRAVRRFQLHQSLALIHLPALSQQ